MRTTKYAATAAIINEKRTAISPWMQTGAIVRITEDKPREIPQGSPAWYLPASGDIFIYAPDVITLEPAALAAVIRRVLDGDCKAIQAKGRMAAKISEGEDPRKLKPVPFTPDELEALIVLGMVQHEAAHSHWSKWMISAMPHLVASKMTRDEMAVITEFEEIRIEARAAELTTKLQTALDPLRQSFGWLMSKGIADVGEGASKRTMGSMWLLAYGRHLAEIATADEVRGIDTVARTVLTEAVVDELGSLLTTAMNEPATNIERSSRVILKTARRWIELLGEEGGEGDGHSCGAVRIAIVGEPGSGAPGSGEPGEGADGEGSGSGSGKAGDEEGKGAGGSGDGDSDDDGDTGGKILEIHHGNSDHIAAAGSQLLNEEDIEILQRVLDDMSEYMETPIPDEPVKLADPISTAARIFGQDQTKKSETRFERRKPSAKQRALAGRIARQLEILKSPAITKTKISTLLPPGRLRTRDAVVAAADRSAGRATLAKPWSGVQRKHSLVRPTTIGIMTDVSGSMSWAEPVVAEFAYVYGTAGHRIAARTAALAFGATTDAVLRPGELPVDVTHRPARDGHENFDEAAAALEGVLHLTSRTQDVRVVLIVSDAQLVGHQEKPKCLRWLKQWSDAGVMVVWVGASERAMIDKMNKMRGVTVETGRSTNAEEMINTAMRELTKLNKEK